MLLALPLAAVPVGDYISWWKTLPFFVLLMIWARLLTWADKDAPVAYLPRQELNIGNLAGLIVAFFAAMFMPEFWLALLVFLGVFLVEVGVYLAIRNAKVGLKDLGQQFNTWISSFGKKAETTIEAKAGQVVISGKQTLAPPGSDDPVRPAYDALQTLLADPMLKGCERVDLAPAAGGASGAESRYTIDGVTYDGPAFDAVAAQSAIAMLKGVAGLDLGEVRKPQVGSVKLQTQQRRSDVQVQTAGNNAGEAMRLIFDPKKRYATTLDQTGLEPDQVEMIRQSIAANSGVVLVAAPKTMGLTTMLYAILRSHDAFLTHIQTIERAPDADLEGIKQNKLPAQPTTAEELKVAAWVVSQEPDTILVSELGDSRSAQELAKYAISGKRVYIGLRAGSTFEAISAWRKLVGDDSLAVRSLSLAIAGRVYRKLCNACKESYAPNPETLRKLNLNADRVTELFQARQRPPVDQKGRPIPCDFCHDVRFTGRTASYELFPVDDEVRQTILSGGSTQQIRAAFRKVKGRTLQEQILGVVERGDTSIPEMIRVLKIGEAAPAQQQAARPE